MSSGEPILRAENLVTYFETSDGFLDRLRGRSQQVRAVDGVDLALAEGETLGVVGESGCGKTTLGRTLLRLIEPTDGTIHYRGEDLTAASAARLRELRTDLQYVFQDPISSLNPRLTVGDIVGEPLEIHDIASGEARADRVGELLETVGLRPRHAPRYPHEFSGGQRQRIGIARALAVDPEVIVCDEPVSALDVSVQAQILNLLADLQDAFGLSYVFIAHDLSVVEHIADRVAVMYLGEIVERGTTTAVFEPPHHPYTEALLSAIPEPDPRWEGDQILLPGTVPSPIDPPSGCRFHTRCPRVIPPDLDVEQGVWRQLLAFKLRLRDADGIEPLFPSAAAEDLEPRSRASMDELVREAFDLPEALGDRVAESTLDEAIEQLSAGDVDAAHDRLASLESPCEVHHPTLRPGDESHEIACLLYADENASHEPGDGGEFLH